MCGATRPGYLSYLAAVVGVDRTSSDAAGHGARLRVAGAAALFIAGFTVAFLMGTIAILRLTTTVISSRRHQRLMGCTPADSGRHLRHSPST